MADVCDPEQVDLFKRICTTAYDIDEALVRQNLKPESLELLRKKLKTSKIVPKLIVNNQLLLFLNSAKGDIDAAAEKIEKYYELKQTTPEFFKNRDLAAPEIQACFENCYYVGLPVTPNNCSVILHKLRSPDPKDYDFDNAVKTYIMKVESYAYENGPRSGTIFIDDLDGTNFWHLFRPSISSVRKGMKFLQEGSPLDVKEIHIFNTVWFFDKIIALVKPFIRSEMLNRIHFHPTNMDWEKFYNQYIPKSCLPSDYGGDLPSVEDMHQKQKESIMEMRQYFLNEEKQVNKEFDKYADDYDRKRASGECR